MQKELVLLLLTKPCLIFILLSSCLLDAVYRAVPTTEQELLPECLDSIREPDILHEVGVLGDLYAILPSIYFITEGARKHLGFPIKKDTERRGFTWLGNGLEVLELRMILNSLHKLMARAAVKSKVDSRFKALVDDGLEFGLIKLFKSNTAPFLLQRQEHYGIQLGKAGIILSVIYKL